jgi:hypothetical protein
MPVTKHWLRIGPALYFSALVGMFLSAAPGCCFTGDAPYAAIRDRASLNDRGILCPDTNIEFNRGDLTDRDLSDLMPSLLALHPYILKFRNNPLSDAGLCQLHQIHSLLIVEIVSMHITIVGLRCLARMQSMEIISADPATFDRVDIAALSKEFPHVQFVRQESGE